MARSTTLKNVILDLYLSGATPHISLHTTDPVGDGSNEVTGGSYVRKPATFGAAAGGAADNTVAVEFTLMPACTVTHCGIWSALAGTWQQGGALTASKTVNAGDTFRFPIGDLDVQEVDV